MTALVSFGLAGRCRRRAWCRTRTFSPVSLPRRENVSRCCTRRRALFHLGEPRLAVARPPRDPSPAVQWELPRYRYRDCSDRTARPRPAGTERCRERERCHDPGNDGSDRRDVPGLRAIPTSRIIAARAEQERRGALLECPSRVGLSSQRPQLSAGCVTVGGDRFSRFARNCRGVTKSSMNPCVLLLRRTARGLHQCATVRDVSRRPASLWVSLDSLS